ncbi:MAG: hypothetical protein KAS15_02390 [Nanoarchaeota archaeon]|nr:hypothetical protein [Nanoarchaeota archaeon]MCK5629142.1 hypothetical protein [Nanoarchaeota archaeon]
MVKKILAHGEIIKDVTGNVNGNTSGLVFQIQDSTGHWFKGSEEIIIFGDIFLMHLQKYFKAEKLRNLSGLKIDIIMHK